MFALQRPLFFGWLALASRLAMAETVVIEAVSDTSIFEAAPGNNLGSSTTLAVGGTQKKQAGRGLIRFDVARAIPTNAVLIRATLAFRVMKDPAGAAGSTFAVHRMLVPWTEGNGSGNLGLAAVAGESTWTNQSHPELPWSSPGGTAGTEFAPDSSAVVAMAGEGSYEMQAAGLAADVQAWLSNPTHDFGWMLKSDQEQTAGTARRVATREDPPNAPKLSVEYSVPSPMVIDHWGVVGGRFEIGFRAEAGNIFEIQSRADEIDSLGWNVLTNFVVKLISTNVVFSEPLRPGARFYRVADVGDVD